MRLQVQSNGRLHFGLAEISAGEPNCFAGIGLMVQHSFGKIEVEVVAEPEGIAMSGIHVRTTITAGSLSSSGVADGDSYWLPRLQPLLDRWCIEIGTLPIASVRLIETPIPHCGLGSGTQMACTLIGGLIAASRLSSGSSTDAVDPTDTDLSKMLFAMASSQEGQSSEAHELARKVLGRLSQRGARSNIGLSGFLEGGFIVDRGVGENSRTVRTAFPENWPILILNNRSFVGDSGSREVAMFEACSKFPNPNRETMLKLITDQIVPSIQSQDWKSFDEAIGSYGRMAGRIFSSVQGGLYRTPRIGEIVSFANQIGMEGAVQSSWGPSICIVAREEDHAKWCADELTKSFPEVNIQFTSAANDPAKVTTG